MTASYLDPEQLKVLRSELLSLIEAADLPDPVDESAIAELAIIQATLHDNLGELACRLSEGVITKREYINGLDVLLAAATTAGGKAMGGVEQFHAVFGDLKASSFGDTEAFAEHR